MTDNRAITWEETDDPQACQTNSTVFQEHTRDPVRTPFQWDDTMHAGFSDAQRTWLPVHANYLARNLKAQTEATRSTFKLYQHLIQLRKDEIFRNGTFRSMAVSPELFAFVRTLPMRNPVVVYINLGVSRTINIADFLQATEIPPNVRGKVLVVSNDSRYRIGDLIFNPGRFELARFDAIAMELEDSSQFTEAPTTQAPTTTAGARSTLIASFLLIVSAALLSKLN